MLAAIAGGYRTLLRARRATTPTPPSCARWCRCRCGAPTSTSVPDNRVSALLLELPVGVDDPVERLAVVKAEMAELKASHMAEAGEVVTDLGDLAPPMVVGTVEPGRPRGPCTSSPQRSVNTVTTNVPGPQFPLYCLGREMLEYRPFVPIAQGVRVGTAILSYNGRLAFGITGDLSSGVDPTCSPTRSPPRSASSWRWRRPRPSEPGVRGPGSVLTATAVAAAGVERRRGRPRRRAGPGRRR